MPWCYPPGRNARLTRKRLAILAVHRAHLAGHPNSVRYHVKARLKPGREGALLEAINRRTLGKGSVAEGEYLRNMNDARFFPDQTARWVESKEQNTATVGLLWSWERKKRAWYCQPLSPHDIE